MSQRTTSRHRPRPIAWVIITLALIVSALGVTPAQAALPQLSRIVVTETSCSPADVPSAHAAMGALDKSGNLAKLGDYPVKIDGVVVSFEKQTDDDAAAGIYRLSGLSAADHSITVPGYLDGSVALPIDVCAASTAKVYAVHSSSTSGTSADGNGSITLTVYNAYWKAQTCDAHVKENAKVGSVQLNSDAADEATIAGLGAGTYNVYVTCQFGERIDVGQVTVPLAGGPVVNPSANLLGKCVLSSGAIAHQTTVVFDNTKSTEAVDLVLRRTVHGSPDDETFNVAAGKSLSKVYVYYADGEYSGEKVIYDVFVGTKSLAHASYDVQACANQAAPKASVSGTAKVTTSTAPRTLTIVNSDDLTDQSNAYKWVLSGPVKASGTTKLIANKGSVSLKFNLKPGSYTFAANGSDGSVTIKLSVGKYAAPKLTKITSRKSAIVKLRVSYPHQDVYYHYKKPGSSKWSSWRKKSTNVGPGERSYNLKNPYKDRRHRATQYQFRVTPRYPTDKPAYVSFSLKR